MNQYQYYMNELSECTDQIEKARISFLKRLFQLQLNKSNCFNKIKL